MSAHTTQCPPAAVSPDLIRESLNANHATGLGALADEHVDTLVGRLLRTSSQVGVSTFNSAI
jgi:hypothetical protein